MTGINTPAAAAVRAIKYVAYVWLQVKKHTDTIKCKQSEETHTI